MKAPENNLGFVALSRSFAMARVPFGQSHLSPRRANNFLDTCAFDPKYAPEGECAQQIRVLGNEAKVHLTLAHSIQKEIAHPNTPAEVKRHAAALNFSIKTDLTPKEVNRLNRIHAILTGCGKPEKYEADSVHVFEAGKYGGYFVTTDRRILDKRAELNQTSGARILTPCEWLAVYEDDADHVDQAAGV